MSPKQGPPPRRRVERVTSSACCIIFIAYTTYPTNNVWNRRHCDSSASHNHTTRGDTSDTQSARHASAVTLYRTHLSHTLRHLRERIDGGKLELPTGRTWAGGVGLLPSVLLMTEARPWVSVCGRRGSGGPWERGGGRGGKEHKMILYTAVVRVCHDVLPGDWRLHVMQRGRRAQTAREPRRRESPSCAHEGSRHGLVASTPLHFDSTSLLLHQVCVSLSFSVCARMCACVYACICTCVHVHFTYIHVHAHIHTLPRARTHTHTHTHTHTRACLHGSIP